MHHPSNTTSLGLALVPVATASRIHGIWRRGIAKGWIAIGDISFGLLVSVGGVALGTGLKFGGLGVGLICVSGLSIALLLAIGGFAIGYLALGGAALACRGAVGGLALARIFHQDADLWVVLGEPGRARPSRPIDHSIGKTDMPEMAAQNGPKTA